ncbi:tumor necrosis factor receptor superfamily member 10A-like isoform X2 [Amblyraja radiata]|uniref:tumor necrosis factor receptor superfamily member 10A-like isoform X2 n=1 Tax=Amblyraja radiata TaxID=386614 RepID=UPI001403060D|nr:tumor necrosis factor receptor superfamily member 10A-like isoform X2 [Amblyraja radiata]
MEFPLLVVGLCLLDARSTDGLPVNSSAVYPASGRETWARPPIKGNRLGDMLHHGRRNRCKTEDYYRVRSDLCCRNCPAGTHVTEHCRKDQERAKCEPCVKGEAFTEYENGLTECMPCTVCRDDEEQVAACNVSKNAVCQCQAGRYFCTDNRVCEMCRRCTSRCPDGEIVQNNCTPTSNTVCRKNIPGKDSPQMSRGMLAVVIVSSLVLALAFFLGLILAVRYIWKKYPQLQQSDPENEMMQGADPALVNDNHLGTSGRGGTSVDTSGHNADNDNSEAMTLLVNKPEASPEDRAGACDQGPCHSRTVDLPLDQGDTSLIGQNGLSSSRDLACVLNTTSLCNCGATGNETGGASNARCSAGITPSVSDTDTVTSKHHCSDNKSRQIEDLRRSFNLFIEKVPLKKWRQFMRKLDLTDNEIETAETNNSKNIEEAHYQMLNTWLQKAGRAASLNVLLNTLKDMDLNDAADNIQKNLKSSSYEVLTLDLQSRNRPIVAVSPP